MHAFATPTPHYRELNARYNLMIESGRREDIASTVCLDYSLLMSGSFDAERYLEWSAKIYGKHTLIPKWSKDYNVIRDADFLSLEDFRCIEKLGKEITDDIKLYIPVSWTTEGVKELDVRNFLRKLIGKSGRVSVPLNYFVIRKIKVPSFGERIVLYSRLSFLRTFRTGRDLIRYREMAVNFNVVYGFE